MNLDNKELAKHRVIGINHVLKVLREEELINDAKTAQDAVVEIYEKLQDVKTQADFKLSKAKRFRTARSDCSIPSMISKIEALFQLPSGSVKLVYPSGRKAQDNLTVRHLRERWNEEYE